MKAFSPAPVRLTPCTDASSFASSNAACKSVQVGVLSALSTLGRLTVTYAIDAFFEGWTVGVDNAALGKGLGTVAGEGVNGAACETIIISSGWGAAGLRAPAAGTSDEGAVTGNGFADDQILHLICAFVGVQRLGIGEEARDIVVGDDAVTAQDLAPPRDRLARFRRTERLRQRRMMVAELAFVIELRQAEHQALACGQIGKHLGEQVLNHLERSDRLAELQSFLCVLDGCFECAHLDAGRRPTHHVSRHPQHACGIAERIAALQAVRLGYPHILQGDLAVLDHLERNLVLDLLDAETGRRLVLDNESLHLIVAEIARPDDGNVAPWRVAHPPLLAIENPGIAFTLGRRGQTGARVRSD